MLVVIARYLVTAGKESIVEPLLDENAGASRAEPGCLEFTVFRAIDEPRAFLLYERYTDDAAFQAHRRTPHFKRIIENQVVPLLDERVFTRMEPVAD